MQVFEPVAPEELVRSQDPELLFKVSKVGVLGDRNLCREISPNSPQKKGLVYRNFNEISQEIQVGSGNPGW